MIEGIHLPYPRETLMEDMLQEKTADTIFKQAQSA